MFRPPSRVAGSRALLALALCCAGAVPAYAAELEATNSRPAVRADTLVLPTSVPDPLEAVNRVMWGFNQGLLIGVVQPSSQVYRRVVIKPVREGIANVGRNLTFPGRLVNHLLQGRWEGAGQESYRFLCNSVVGVGGVVDVASHWHIPKSNQDFGRTFGRWGWKPNVFLMLPLLGPSNDRDGVGLAADTAANPLTWVDPPYTYISAGISYNGLTETVDDSVRFIKSESDSYSLTQYAWTFARETEEVDLEVKGEQDPPSLETLPSVFFTFQDPAFPERGRTRSVLIPATGKKLPFTFWLQAHPAPVVYLLPGLGSHRLAAAGLGLAEMLHGKGFSVVCVSSVFHPEFMERASTAAVPAYPPVDTADLRNALTEIDHHLESLYPGRFGTKALLGYSMGGFHCLCLAATHAVQPASGLRFDRYVGICPPAHLLHAVSKLDDLFQAPMEIPAAHRTERLRNTFLKVAALTRPSPSPRRSLPFNAVESKFLVGAAFRFTLRDVIFSSQRRRNQGVLQEPIHPLRRNAVYQEILQYSYREYLTRFVIPYYRSRGIDLSAPDALAQASDLRSYGASLRANPEVRLVVNRNDLLLTADDREWFRTGFNSSQVTFFEHGGHMGNLADPQVQQAILAALQDVKP